MASTGRTPARDTKTTKKIDDDSRAHRRDARVTRARHECVTAIGFVTSRHNLTLRFDARVARRGSAQMRMGERIVTYLFQYPLNKKYGDAQARLSNAARAMRTGSIKWTNFRYKFVKGSGNGKVVPFGFTRKRAKTIMAFIADEVLPCVVGDADPHRGHWEQFLHHYICAVAKMRKLPDLLRGEPGYAEQHAQDATELGQHCDAACAAALRIFGDEAVSNYFHWLRCGYYKYWMLKTGCYPATWSNDGCERSNEDQQVWFFKHTPRGGGRMEQTSFARGLCDFSLMKLGFTTGEIDGFVGETFSDEAAASKRKRSHLSDPVWRADHPRVGRQSGSCAVAADRRAVRRRAVETAMGTEAGHTIGRPPLAPRSPN
jgi:hypothetical protein